MSPIDKLINEQVQKLNTIAFVGSVLLAYLGIAGMIATTATTWHTTTCAQSVTQNAIGTLVGSAFAAVCGATSLTVMVARAFYYTADQ